MNRELLKAVVRPSRHFNSLFLIPYSLLLLLTSGCQSFALSDNTATDKILATHYWADLEKQYRPAGLLGRRRAARQPRAVHRHRQIQPPFPHPHLPSNGGWAGMGE